MGSDKATINFGGQRLIGRILDALAPLDSITIVGGDEHNLSGLGHAWFPDEHPGEGPLGALVTGLRMVDAQLVVSSACDLPHVQQSTVLGLVEQLRTSGADAAVPLVGGRRQWHLAAWNARVFGSLEISFDGGERSLRGASRSLQILDVVFADTKQFVDLDTPQDLEREFPG